MYCALFSIDVITVYFVIVLRCKWPCGHLVKIWFDLFGESVALLIVQYLDKNDDIHSHNTRLKDSVHLQRPNTEFGKRSLKYKAANIT